MKKGHIKISIEDVDTKNIAIFDIDMNNSSANFDLNNFDPEVGSDLFSETFVGILDTIGMTKKFLDTINNNY